jgi:hypothetical protein
MTAQRILPNPLDPQKTDAKTQPHTNSALPSIQQTEPWAANTINQAAHGGATDPAYDA